MNDIQVYRQAVPRYEPTLVPGDVVYEHLLKNNPKKLKRLMKEEQKRYSETRAPGYEEQYWIMAEAGKKLIEQVKKASADYLLLELNSFRGPLLKKDVRNAYRRQARKLHPDAGGTDDTFKELYAAYRRILASVPKE